MKEKIPCIRCDSQLWEYIKLYLKEWGYKIVCIANIKQFRLIVINYTNNLGYVANVSSSNNLRDYNRELVTNVEEFLERAAKLKGFIYKRKDIMEKEFDVNKLEVGMIVEYKTREKRIVLRDSEGNLFLSGIDSYKSDMSHFIGNTEIYKVYKIISNSVTLHDLLVGGKELELIWEKPKELELIWEKPKEVELTMQEIADKFGISVEQLKIKK